LVREILETRRRVDFHAHLFIGSRQPFQANPVAGLKLPFSEFLPNGYLEGRGHGGKGTGDSVLG
jgi:hypothetical protein